MTTDTDNTVTYTITVDKDMFPYAPGSEVVVHDEEGETWMDDIFIYVDNEAVCKFQCKDAAWTNCYPATTHAHLLGTTYPADTPACAKCGKAAPNGNRGTNFRIQYKDKTVVVCEQCYAAHTALQGTATTADGVKVCPGDTVWHPEYGEMNVSNAGTAQNVVGCIYNNRKMSECYLKPCATLADGSVVFAGDEVWHPVHGECYTRWDAMLKKFEVPVLNDRAKTYTRIAHCYPLGSRIMTPAELENLGVKVTS